MQSSSFLSALQLLSILASLAVICFFAFHHKRCDFRGNDGIFKVKWDLIFSKILNHYKNYRIIFIRVGRSSYKERNICIRSNLNYHDIFSTNPLIWNFTKIHFVEGELFRAGRRMDGLTDTHEANGCISQFWTHTCPSYPAMCVFCSHLQTSGYSKHRQLLDSWTRAREELYLWYPID
jgi:hypothetical protein